MECYFVSYSRERSIQFWKEKNATPLLNRSHYEDEPGYDSDYEIDNLIIAKELQELFPDLKATLSTTPFDPHWGRPLVVVEALEYKDTPNLNKLLACQRYLTEGQFVTLLALKVKRNNAAIKRIKEERKALSEQTFKISKQDLLEKIASCDLDLNGVASEYDISYTLLDYFVNHYNLTLQSDTELPTKEEIFRLYDQIDSKTLQEISIKSREEPAELLRFLQELKPVVTDLKNNPDSDFLIIGDAIDPESFEVFLKKRSKEILTDIKSHLPSNWVVTR